MILLTVFPHFVVFFKSVAAPWLAIRWQKFCKSISCTASCAHSVVITGVKRKKIWSIQLEWKKKEWPFFFFWLLRMLITIFSLFGFDSFFFCFFFCFIIIILLVCCWKVLTMQSFLQLKKRFSMGLQYQSSLEWEISPPLWESLWSYCPAKSFQAFFLKILSSDISWEFLQLRLFRFLAC